MHRFVILATTSMLAPTAAAGDCAPAYLATKVLTPAGAAIPADGGVVVAASPGGYTPTQEKNPGMKPTWRVRAGAKLSAPKIDTIAPGLFVYRVTPASETVPTEMEGDDKKVVASVVAKKAKSEAYAAPVVKKLEYTNTMSRHSSQYVTATLEAEPPAGTVAIVITNEKGKPLSWGPIGKGTTQHGYMHHDCMIVPDGTEVAQVGKVAKVFFVNAEGRVSATSKPIKVSGNNKPNPY